MPTPVVMPQMGESIAEGTIVRWIKKVGDTVDRDEPLFEISTDKVDAEIPSPAAGVLAEITVKEGETVPVNSVVATIRQESEAVEAAAAAPSAPQQPAKGVQKAAASTQPQADGSPSSAPVKARANGSEQTEPISPKPSARQEPAGEDVRRQKSSPLVRR